MFVIGVSRHHMRVRDSTKELRREWNRMVTMPPWPCPSRRAGVVATGVWGPPSQSFCDASIVGRLDPDDRHMQVGQAPPFAAEANALAHR